VCLTFKPRLHNEQHSLLFWMRWSFLGDGTKAPSIINLPPTLLAWTRRSNKSNTLNKKNTDGALPTQLYLLSFSFIGADTCKPILGTNIFVDTLLAPNRILDTGILNILIIIKLIYNANSFQTKKYWNLLVLHGGSLLCSIAKWVGFQTDNRVIKTDTTDVGVKIR